jgi:APA family basic amino acid/polyamine antiporter
MADAALVADDREDKRTGFIRGLGLLDSTMIVAGSMIGSGIFIVSADIARQVGAPGWLLVVWIITGLLTLMAALSYGELAAMMPKAGGQYVYLREAFSPLWGFLYGWTLFLVIQTGTIAAVAVGFAKYLGVFWHTVSESNYIIAPVRIAPGYALSLSTAQLVGVLLIVLLTVINIFGLKLGKLVQNIFTTAKTGALVALIVLGIIVGLSSTTAAHANFGNFWTIRGSLEDVGHGLTAATMWGLFVGICVAQTNSLFSADAWNNITFTAGEVKDPRRNIPLSLAFGTFLVIGLYLLANIAYLVTLPLETIQTVPLDRVASATANVIFPSVGASLMAAAIMISTFGCNNGLILAGARAYYAMARDGLFFRSSGRLNEYHVPAWGLVIQGIWAVLLVLPRVVTGTDKTGAPTYGSLYNNLLTYVISAALIFYILTIWGIFRLRRKRPDAERPYRAFGYPLIPILYIIGATVILLVLFIYQTATTWPGLIIVLTGIPVYFIWRKIGVPMDATAERHTET